MSDDRQSDPALIRGCLEGDQRAWNTMVDRYKRLVYSIPRRYGMDDNDAEDVFQNVFAILLRHLDQLKDQTRLSSWLITTAHRECWRLGRRKPKDEPLEERDIRADAPPDALIERWERQHIVRTALERLGDPCKALLEALFLCPSQQGYETIAASLNMKIGSIGPTRARCFKKMEAILNELGYQPDGAAEDSRDE